MATKKVAIIVLLTTLLVAAAVAAAIILSGVLNKDKNNINASNKAIQDLCQNTYYQQTCIDTLSKLPTNTSDTKTLITSTFRIAIENLYNVIRQSASLQEASKAGSGTANAYRACGEFLEDCIIDLDKTIARTESFVAASDFDIFIDDVKTWLTGALTYQETCQDYFDEVKSDGGDKMRQLLKLSRELTINGLAFANEFHRLLMPNQETGDSRRALSDDEKPITAQNDYTDYCEDYPYIPECVDYGKTGSPKKKTDKSKSNRGASRRALEDEKPITVQNDYEDLCEDYPAICEDYGKAGAPKKKTRKHLLEAWPRGIIPNVTVAQDNTGKYKNISEALREAPQKSNQTFVIYIKAGVYNEHVEVNSSTWSVMFLGDGPTKTRITGNKSVKDKTGPLETDHLGTSDTATVIIKGSNFMAIDIGFENTAGSVKEQAVALRIDADRAVVYNCHIDGYQDSLYAHNHRQFYRDCTISGTIDFIFGNARAIFQNCTMLVRKPLPNQQCMVTAQGWFDRNESSGFVIHSSRILAAPDYPNVGYKTYLGRPWKPLALTIVMQSELGGLIAPEGWHKWNDTTPNTEECYYAEFQNRGPGADLSGRVKWPGIKNLTGKQAKGYNPRHYMQLRDWIQAKYHIPWNSWRI